MKVRSALRLYIVGILIVIFFFVNKSFKILLCEASFFTIFFFNAFKSPRLPQRVRSIHTLLRLLLPGMTSAALAASPAPGGAVLPRELLWPVPGSNKMFYTWIWDA